MSYFLRHPSPQFLVLMAHLPQSLPLVVRISLSTASTYFQVWFQKVLYQIPKHMVRSFIIFHVHLSHVGIFSNLCFEALMGFFNNEEYTYSLAWPINYLCLCSKFYLCFSHSIVLLPRCQLNQGGLYVLQSEVYFDPWGYQILMVKSCMRWNGFD